MKVAAWDANLVTPHKRMGNAGVNLETFCDGECPTCEMANHDNCFSTLIHRMFLWLYYQSIYILSSECSHA